MAQDTISSPPYRGAVDAQDATKMLTVVARPWRVFFDAVFRICFAATQSGTSAQRPDSGLWVGRPYWDTTLGYPIWWDGAQWVDATGSPA